METHYTFTVNVNAAPLKGEMTVLFSGKGEPVSGHYIGPAVHDYYLIHIVLEGEGVFEALGETHRCAAGDAFVIFPDILVKYEADEEKPWKYMWVGFSGSIVEEALESIGITPDRAVVRNCPLEQLGPMFDHVFNSLDRTEYAAIGSMEASGWLRLILGKLARQEEAREEGRRASRATSYHQIEQAIRLLSLQYAQQLSIETIAKTLGYHRTHLTKLFKEATGVSPQQYLYKVRMKKAEELLGGGLTVAQIASSVGYSDPLFFTKQFHKWSGMSPTSFRKAKAAELPAEGGG